MAESTGSSTLRERLFGNRERLGWWTLPAFLVVGLAGAVLAGTFTVVWQTQKIQALEDEIADALAELRDGVTAVEEAGDQALADIEAQLGDVEAVINAGLPVESAAQIGVALLRVEVPPDAQASPTPQAAPASGQGGDGSARLILANTQPSEQPSEPAQPQPSESSGGGQPVPQESTAPPPPPPPSTRVGSAVAVALDGATTFFATSYALVTDPRVEDGVLDAVTIDVGNGRVAAAVHSWDASRDLALVRAEVGSVNLATWRAEDEPVAAGDRAFLVGVTTAFDTVQQSGSVTFLDGTTVLTDHDVVGTLRGGAMVDSEGRLVAIGSADYRPFVDDDRPANIPIRLLCESLLRACGDTDQPEG